MPNICNGCYFHKYIKEKKHMPGEGKFTFYLPFPFNEKFWLIRSYGYYHQVLQQIFTIKKKESAVTLLFVVLTV